jgi:hypothetical protein
MTTRAYSVAYREVPDALLGISVFLFILFILKALICLFINIFPCRWRVNKPPTMDNLVYMTAEEFDAHIKITSVEGNYPKDVVERIDNLLAELK